MSYADIDPKFTSIAKDLADSSKNTAKGLRAEEPMNWDRLSSDPNVTNLTDLQGKFNRDNLAKVYKDLLSQHPTPPAGEAIVVKIQNDWIAAIERDYINRHRSRIRQVGHESGRREYIGADSGTLNGLIPAYILNIKRKVDGALA